MPIYLYRCGECQAHHEALQKVSDAHLIKCPHCGAEALKRVLAPVGIIFKGTGFHKNDYSGSGSKSSSSASSSTTDKSTTATSDSAPSTSASDSGGSSSSTSSGDSGKVA